ncbi:uncharacterized protein CLUP02_06851 [Colletotrichum lupini]|uniref:Uncharacterized protein n=1 Tax=Colletotrichum lupini TaxID=145971 RepID=A0A9Q8WG50_9PEZI|nr:uncharacterized protein CLUP02_06851 [Colletotrichum lupini]UQC81365.1 hypothetical protein CLUP02_06851 [Colletotrichum lupini]
MTESGCLPCSVQSRQHSPPFSALAKTKTDTHVLERQSSNWCDISVLVLSGDNMYVPSSNNSAPSVILDLRIQGRANPVGKPDPGMEVIYIYSFIMLLWNNHTSDETSVILYGLSIGIAATSSIFLTRYLLSVTGRSGTILVLSISRTKAANTNANHPNLDSFQRAKSLLDISGLSRQDCFQNYFNFVLLFVINLKSLGILQGFTAFTYQEGSWWMRRESGAMIKPCLWVSGCCDPYPAVDENSNIGQATPSTYIYGGKTDQNLHSWLETERRRENGNGTGDSCQVYARRSQSQGCHGTMYRYCPP